MSIEAMRRRAIDEMDKYVKALEKFVDSRMMSLAEGELAAYSKLGVLSKEKAMEYRIRLNQLSGQRLDRLANPQAEGQG